MIRHHSSRHRIREPWYLDRGQDWRLDPDVVIGVDADLLLLGGERKLAKGLGLELVVGLEVGPAPDSAVDDVGKSFSM